MNDKKLSKIYAQLSELYRARDVITKKIEAARNNPDFYELKEIDLILIRVNLTEGINALLNEIIKNSI